MSSSSALLVRYNEIGLKRGNRPLFERVLQQNLKSALSGRPGVHVNRIRGRALVRAEVPLEELSLPVSRVFGVASLSPARETEKDLDAMGATARDLTSQALAGEFAGCEQVPFRVTTNRADKTFPMTGMQIDERVGGLLLENFPALKVDLGHPLLNVEIDLRDEGVWVFAGRRPGPGGLPVGTLGKGMCLLSGGIDSPVAAWLAMKRGIRVEFVSFFSAPWVGPQYREKLLRIVEHLSLWQPVSVLHLIPFTAVQTAIRDRCPEPYRTVLYRRAMQRIASRLAAARRGQVLITGESVGQVASQTLENMTVIEEASRHPVLRPLVTYDKHETMALARRIGTYELSLLPAADTCTVFAPSRPVIRGRLRAAREAEEHLDLEALTEEAVRGTERFRFPPSP